MSRVCAGSFARRFVIAVLATVLVLLYLLLRAVVYAVAALVNALAPVWLLLAPVPKMAPVAGVVWLGYSVADYFASTTETRRSIHQAWRVRFER
jgi:hypothetical protein